MYFHRIKLDAFCHATEDITKVKEAMLKLLPFETTIEESAVKGSFGNEIISLSVQFEKQHEINKIVEFLKGKLGEVEDFNVEEHVNEDNFFWIRFNKQEALAGNIVLGGTDVIQLKGKVAAFPAKWEMAVEIMKKVWE